MADEPVALRGSRRSAARIAQGAPATTAGAHLDPDADRFALVAELFMPPTLGFLKGAFERVVEIVKHGVGAPLLIDKPVVACLGWGTC